MAGIPLEETIDALRAELLQAIKKGLDADVQFPVGDIQLEFQVGVTRTADAKAGVRFFVVDASGGGSVASQSVQKVTIQLKAPVDRAGRPVKVASTSDQRP